MTLLSLHAVKRVALPFNFTYMYVGMKQSFSSTLDMLEVVTSDYIESLLGDVCGFARTVSN